jgi:hypothetical protein
MASSDGYSGSSEGYSSTGEDRHHTQPHQPPEPWWAQEGFSNLWEALAHQEALNDAMWGSSREKPHLDAPDEWLPAEGPAARPLQDRQDSTHQVNIRLGERDYDRLAILADDYGVQKAVMARMLVRRALNGVFEDRESG